MPDAAARLVLEPPQGLGIEALADSQAPLRFKQTPDNPPEADSELSVGGVPFCIEPRRCFDWPCGVC